MLRLSIATVCLLSLSAAAALRAPAKPPHAPATAALSRRSALGAAALAALPALAGRASAYEYSFEKSSESFEYKSREFSTDGMMDYQTKSDKTKKLECPEGMRASPDGFGGRTCKGKVKGVTELASEKAQKILTGQEAPAAAPAAAFKAAPATAAPKKAEAPPPSSSSKPLTLDELIDNSIRQKADLLGRDLNDSEKADMTAKVKKLMQ